MRDDIQRSGSANLQKGIESVGGTLSLNPSELRFTPHIVNVNREVVQIDISTIASVEPARTRFLGFLPLFDNAFTTSLPGGREFRFTVRERDKWVDAIRRLLEKNDA